MHDWTSFDQQMATYMTGCCTWPIQPGDSSSPPRVGHIIYLSLSSCDNNLPGWI